MKLVLLTILMLGFALAQDETEPTASMDFIQVCNYYGYPVESDIVTTEDGYLLKLFRITGGLHRPAGSNIGKPPVLFQHGILDSADGWVMRGQDLSPAFFMANQGYDVFVANNRGTKYSRDHRSITPDSKEFWQFSFVELANDGKANIEFIRKTTGYEKVIYIGHSQGTSQLFAGISLDPDWFAKRVSLFAALGPVARLENCKSGLLSLVSGVRGAFVVIANGLGLYEMFPSNYLTRTTMRTLCGTFPTLC